MASTQPGMGGSEMNNRFYVLLAAGTTLIVLPTDIRAQDNEQSVRVLEEIIVTAQRRDENLQDVPISITAFNAADIDARQVQVTADLGRYTPGLYTRYNAGQNTALTISLRGVGQNDSIALFDPGVGMYIDDVFLARTAGANLSLFDLERIEVLRGPQGTLYGRNTPGGAIKFVTRAPSEDAYGRFEASYGKWQSWNVKGVVNGPISEDTVQAKLAVEVRQRDKGWTRNVTLNKRVNTVDAWGLRGAVRFVPNEDVEFIARADYGAEDAIGQYGFDLARDPDIFVSFSGQDLFNDVEHWGISGTLNWDFGGIRLQSITAYRDLSQDFVIDLADNEAPLFLIENDGRHKQFSEELQLSGSAADEKLNWLVGLYYMIENNDSIVSNTIFGGFAPKIFANNADAYAVFSQFNYDLTESLTLTVGGRYTREEKDVDVQQFAPGGVLVFDNSDLAAIGTPTDRTFEKFTPEVTLDYAISDDVLTYARFARGFKGGGWAGRATTAATFSAFNEEVLDAYELGVKSQLFNDRLRLNVAAFYSDYQDYAAGRLDENQQLIVLNAAEARIQGLEIEYNIVPADGIELFGFIALMDSKFTNIDPGVPIAVGAEVPDVPEAEIQVGFNWDIPVEMPGTLTFRPTFTHRDSFFATTSNAPVNNIEKTDLLDLLLRYESEDEGWYASIGCTNCTDDRYYHSAVDLSFIPIFGTITGWVMPPIEWKFTLGANF